MKEKKYFGKLPNQGIYKVDDKEVEIKKLKPSKTKFLSPYIVGLSLFMVAFGFTFITIGILCMGGILLKDVYNYFGYGTSLFLFGVLITTVCIILIVARVFKFRHEEYIITNRRVIIITGHNTRHVYELQMKDIDEVLMYHSLFDNLGKIKTGSLLFKMKRIKKNDQPVYTFKHLTDCNKLRIEIQNLIDVYEWEEIDKNAQDI